MSGSRSRRACRKATVTVDVLRDAMSVDSLDRCGLYFGTTGVRSTRRTTKVTAGRQSFVTARGLVGRGPDAGMIRVVLPAHLKTLVNATREIDSTLLASPASVRSSTPSKIATPVLLGTIRDPTTKKRAPSSASLPAKRTSLTTIRGAAPRCRGLRRRAVLRDWGDGGRLRRSYSPCAHGSITTGHSRGETSHQITIPYARWNGTRGQVLIVSDSAAAGTRADLRATTAGATR